MKCRTEQQDKNNDVSDEQRRNYVLEIDTEESNTEHSRIFNHLRSSSCIYCSSPTMGIGGLLKRSLVPQILMAYVFSVSGLIVGLLMLLSCVIWPFSRQLYRKINVYLAYAHWSEATFLGQWWSGSEVFFYMDEKDRKKLGKEHVMVIMNHRHDIDWLIGWILTERLGLLGNAKVYGKESLRYLPFLGWEWYFTESIFLKRQWEHDRKVISEDLKRITDYPDGYWVTVLLFPEGTRFTEEKLKVSQEICRAKGYPITRHTLLPRTKGFILSMHGMLGKVPALYNTTIGFPANGPKPTFWNIVTGVKLVAHVHCKRVPLEEVPIDTDEACSDWLRKVFKQKDELYDNYLKNGKFDGEPFVVPRRMHDLVVSLFWIVTTCCPLVYYVIIIFSEGTLLQKLIFFIIVLFAFAILQIIVGVTETEHGSSYGSSAQGQDQTPRKDLSPLHSGHQEPDLLDTEADESKKIQ